MKFTILKKICKKFFPVSFYEFLRKIYWNFRGEIYTWQRFEQKISTQRVSAPVCRDMKISILCNVWNTSVEFLQQMLDSVLNQNYQNWELLINNCSDAEHGCVDEILQKYASDLRVKVFRTENQGIANNSNFILSKADGEFIFLMDHDDILLPNTLEKLADAQEKENSDFVYADEFVLQMAYMRLLKVNKKSFSMDTS